ncbi:hypothetical protein EV368DRAFT_86271 [Lentinula lateritia]|nr:hypothetical protein EV368DRAFT_86271 [Lentinula lateritia]
MVGAPAPQGFGPSAADLGQKFSQRAYTSYRLNQEKKKDGNGPTSAFGNLQNLQKWKGKHSTVLCKDYVSSDIVCISLQTEWMQQQTLPDMSDVGDPLYGLLFDAAHKYWEDPNVRLIVTSIYSPLIEKWVPVLFTYANGATIAHYEYHFLILIEGIAAAALQKNVPITDSLFASLVDFSDPQRIGFIGAFVTYFQAQASDTRSEKDLQLAGQALIKGCLYHYHKAVNQMSWIGDAVPQNTKSDFQKLCRSLPEITDVKHFDDVVSAIQKRWPRVSRWLSWWLMSEHAGMLFPCKLTMAADLAARLPATNAEEAMHATIYCAVGINHPLLKGLDGLLAVEKLFRIESKNALLHVKSHYGKSGRELRKELYQQHGTTYPSCKHPRGAAKERRTKRPISHSSSNSSSSEHLPPYPHHSHVIPSSDDSDNELAKTANELHKAQQKIQLMSPTKLNARSSKPDFGPIKSTTTSELPSAKWDRNSCWLDSSMESLKVWF